MSGKKGLKKINSITSGMNGNVQDDLHLLNSTENGEESKTITCLCNQQKN